ncbi:hypothetical protein EVAR_566_1 [Eumeta japonica]|uniref:Uncharacterized protein n=1 Tax=Eumeta variegata TaxID=151549 RepID=A0A4C1SDP5_EUMVA|nr:hypothetical protein EVAR_566_1 [Eumeta japonica]
MVDKTAFRLLPGMYTRSVGDERLTDTDGERTAGGCGARTRAVLLTTALVLGLALTALTAARELEAAALRREVGALAAELLLLRAQHQALQHKIEHRDIFKKIQMLENTFLAEPGLLCAGARAPPATPQFVYAPRAARI